MSYRIERYRDGERIASTSVPWQKSFTIGVAKKWLRRGDGGFIRVVDDTFVGGIEVWSGRRNIND